MDIKKFAKLLDGRSEGEEITGDEEIQAKRLGFVVIFGYSDDNAEIRGAIYDEVGCYDGGNINLDADGIIEECECECKYFKRAKESAWEIKIICEGNEGYFWTYKTDIDHETFVVLDEEGNKWCRGIVFDIKDLS